VLRRLFGGKTKRIPVNLKDRNKIKEGKLYLKDVDLKEKYNIIHNQA
jgi:uncharacterized protein YaiL (DUF2058 family)